jgi:hypothetical protein
MDDSSVDDSEQASAASTVPLLVTLLSLPKSLRAVAYDQIYHDTDAAVSWEHEVS